jgi:DNA-binding transcriptional LysR family regulator
MPGFGSDTSSRWTGCGAVDARRALVVVGGPTFLDRFGRPSQPQDLRDFRCILLRQSARLLDRWQFSIDGHAITIGVEGPLIVDDVEACARAALRGVGLFRLPRSIMMHYLCFVANSTKATGLPAR